MTNSDSQTALDGDTRRRPTRRQMLGFLGAGGVTAASGFGAIQLLGGDASSSGPANASAPGTSARPAGLSTGIDGRLLVIVELSGGNDGLASVVPESGILRDLRPGLIRDDDEFVDFADGMQLHPGLAPLGERGLAVFQGVGTANPNGSHFEMERRWWAGEGDARLTTGFLGRLCDALASDAAVGGVSLGAGATPALRADHATTIGLPNPGAAWFLTEEGDEWFANLRRGLGDLGVAPTGESAHMSSARRGLDDALAFAEVLRSIDDDDDRGFPANGLGEQLRLAGGLLASDVGLRVVHVQLGGFDTHDNQPGEHGQLMEELGTAVAALQDDLEVRGIADRTLIATTSEFGRRPEQNGYGTDHGTAAPMLLCGPVNPGLHGEAPRLDRLDDDGNLIATALVDDYYATLAEGWLGIPADEVLPRRAEPALELLAT